MISPSLSVWNSFKCVTNFQVGGFGYFSMDSCPFHRHTVLKLCHSVVGSLLNISEHWEKPLSQINTCST